MKRTAFFGLLLLSAAGCNKDRAAQRDLKGIWTVTAQYKISGTDTLDMLAGYEITYQFDECYQWSGHDDLCQGVITTTSSADTITTTQDFEYLAGDEGTTLMFTFYDPSNGVYTDMPSVIDELTESSLKFTLTGTPAIVVEAAK